MTYMQSVAEENDTDNESENAAHASSKSALSSVFHSKPYCDYNSHMNRLCSNMPMKTFFTGQFIQAIYKSIHFFYIVWSMASLYSLNFIWIPLYTTIYYIILCYVQICQWNVSEYVNSLHKLIALFTFEIWRIEKLPFGYFFKNGSEKYCESYFKRKSRKYYKHVHWYKHSNQLFIWFIYSFFFFTEENGTDDESENAVLLENSPPVGSSTSKSTLSSVFNSKLYCEFDSNHSFIRFILSFFSLS